MKKPKSHPRYTLTQILPVFHQLFPQALLNELEDECFNHTKYDRLARPTQLVQALIKAIVLRLATQEAIVDASPGLKLSDPSSLSYDLTRPWLQEFATELNAIVATQMPIYDPSICRHPRFLLDSMPQMIQATQRGNATKYNNVAKGIGVMNIINLDAAAGQSLAQVAKIMPGGWNDTYQVRKVDLIAEGPVYIADRGYYSLETMALWRTKKIHFIVRAKKQHFTYTTEQSLPVPCKQMGSARIESDEIVILGRSTSRHRSRVRLLKAWLDSGEDLWLVTDQFETSQEQLLNQYLERGKVEVYHRFEKNSAGLSHLYSFDDVGMSVQVLVTLLVINLLFASSPQEDEDVVKAIANIFKALRKALGLQTPQKRNTVAQRRAKKPHNKRKLNPRASVT